MYTASVGTNCGGLSLTNIHSFYYRVDFEAYLIPVKQEFFLTTQFKPFLLILEWLSPFTTSRRDVFRSATSEKPGPKPPPAC